MKTEIKETCTRHELADYLETLASQLRSGMVQVADASWQVPESLEIKKAVKEKKGTIKYKLEWQWPTLAEYDEGAQQETVRWQTSFKQVKKDLARSFKELRQAVNEGQFPDKQILDDFAAHSRIFADMAEPDWQESAQEFMEHLENLYRSIELKEMELVAHELNDLQNRMKACHREFK